MKNFIGGLFKKEEDASQARRALREAGFSREDIQILAPRPGDGAVREQPIRAPAVGRAALWGAALLGGLGGLIGLLIGLAIIPLPGVDAATYRMSALFVLTAVLAGLVAGGVTGAILGSAVRLLRTNNKVRITRKGIQRGGVLVVARIGQMNNEETARRILEENGAADLQNLTEKWDASVWDEVSEMEQTRGR
jgi:hypothetical protein